MKKNVLLTFLALFIGFNSFALAGDLNLLNKLDSDKVYDHKDALVKELKRDYYIKLGIYATAAGLVGYGLYKFFAPSAEAVVQEATVGAVGLTSNVQAAKKPSEIKVNNQETITSSKKTLSEEELKKIVIGYDELIKKQEQTISNSNQLHINVYSVFKGYQDVLEKDPELKKKFEEKLKLQLEKNESPSLLWQIKDYFVYTFKSSVVMAAASVLLSTVSPFAKYLRILDKGIDSLIDRIFYHEDLNWYLATHTTLFDVLSQTEKHAQVLAEQTQPTGDFSYHFSGFVDSCNISIHQLEQVLGFMIYKVGVLEKKSPLNAKRASNLAERFFNRINERIAEMTLLLEKIPLEMSAALLLKTKLTELRSFIQESLHAFVAIEFVSDI